MDFNLFFCRLRLFLDCFEPFKFVLFRVVAVLGCAWLSWLFYVAFLRLN